MNDHFVVSFNDDLHPEGEFKGVIGDVEVDEGQFGRQYKFHIDTNESERSLWLWTQLKTGETSKLGRLLMALKKCNYKELMEFLTKDGDKPEFDVRNTIGAAFMVTVEHKENQQGQARAYVTEFRALDGDTEQEEIPF